MTNDEKEIKRKLRILKHAEHSGNITETYRCFGVARSLFYLWRDAYREFGEEGLKRKRPVPKSHPNQTAPEVVDKVLYLRRQYHMCAIRIMWYMERYHAIKISESTVTRILRRYGLRRLPQRSGRRAVHTKRYNKQVPGHHIQMDIKFLTFKGKNGTWLAYIPGCMRINLNPITFRVTKINRPDVSMSNDLQVNYLFILYACIKQLKRM